MRNSNLLLLGLAVTFASAGSAFAQKDDQIQGVTTIGSMAVERTTADIMQHPEPISPDSFFQHLIKSTEQEVDRSGLPMNPNSPHVSQWPPATGNNGSNGKGYGGGRFSPQTPGIQWQGDIYGNLTPSDAYGAVGPTQVVCYTNHNITVYDKTGAVGALNTTMDNFFTSVRAGSGTSDPRITFDRLTNRWFVISINVSTPNRTMIAVSDGPTITGSTVWKYFFTTAPSGTFDDYPSLGVDANGVYIGYNCFTTGYIGAQGIVVQKSSILASGPIVSTRFTFCTGTTDGPYSPRGVDNDDPAPANGYFFGISNTVFGEAVLRRVTGANTASPTIGGNVLITVPSEGQPITPVSSNGSQTHDQIDDRVYDATIHLNRKTGARTLWAAHHSVGNSAGVGGSGDRNIVQWYQVNPVAGTLLQTGSSFSAGAVDHYSFPSVAMSGQGHMAMAFSMIQPSSFVRTGASGRLNGDASGTTQGTTVVYTATQTNTIFANRWGDYSMTKVDPADDQTIWTIQHQCAGAQWQVRVTQLKAPAPSPIASVVPSVLTPNNSYNLVVTGAPTLGSEYFDTDAGYPNRLAASFSGTGITLNSITFSHSNVQSITLNVTVAPAAANGGRNLTITNPDGQSVTLNNAVTVQGSQNITVTPSSYQLNLGNLSSGNIASLNAIDGNSLVVCKGFVPSLTSPFARITVAGNTALTTLTAYAFNSTAKMNSAGVFTHTVECFNYSTTTYDVTNTAAINLSFSTLTATVGANFNNYINGGAVQARINVRQTGFSAITTPCTSVDAASWNLTGN